MTDQPPPKNISIEHGDRIAPSEYARLEADLITGLTEKRIKPRRVTDNKVILIYCQSRDLLQEVSADLKSKLGPDIDVVTTTEKRLAMKLINSGEVDLLIHGPGSRNLPSILISNSGISLESMGTALVLVQNPDSVIESLMNNPKYSVHLTKAICRLNGSIIS